MQTGDLYRQIRMMIANKQFAALKTLNIAKPEKFNWVKEVFENIHVKDHPHVPALTWTDSVQTKNFSFKDLQEHCDQFLNFLRRKGLNQQDVIFSQMPLLPENWLTVLVSIKGGYRLVPAATMLSVQDIVYRFAKLMPAAVIADPESAAKIDEAEVLAGKSVALKIVVNGLKDGWIPFDQIKEEETTADAADTHPDDPLFLFFTSGTTGMPKVVAHTHLSYPLGHLTTAAWIGLQQGDVHYNISQPGWAKFAWSSFFAPWSIGATVFAFYQTGRFNAAEQLSLLEKYKVTTFCAPPTALRMLILENLDRIHSLSVNVWLPVNH